MPVLQLSIGKHKIRVGSPAYKHANCQCSQIITQQKHVAPHAFAVKMTINPPLNTVPFITPHMQTRPAINGKAGF